MNTKRKKEWFDDQSFWKDMYHILFPDWRFERALERVDDLLELTKPKGKDVLDLCCGPGRWCVALAQKGFTLTGVDKIEYLLDKARVYARKERVKIKWIQSDMRDFVYQNSFDLVINMFTSFGYFNKKGEDLIVLENIFESLKPGGVFLIDTMGKERLAKIFTTTTSEELSDGSLLVQRHEIFDDWTRIRNEWILISKGKAKTYKFHHTIYSGQELRDRMEQVGFTNVKLFGNLEGEEYGPEAQRLIAVGIKP